MTKNVAGMIFSLKPIWCRSKRNKSKYTQNFCFVCLGHTKTSFIIRVHLRLLAEKPLLPLAFYNRQTNHFTRRNA